MNGSKKPYSLDEYYKDRYGGQMAVSPLDRAVSQSPESVRPVSAVHAGSTQRRQQFLRSMNVTEEPKQPTAPTETKSDAEGGIYTISLDNLSTESGALTEKEFNSKLTTANTMSMLEDALASLAEWGNRKFVYNAKESPLYTILQQQAEKEARLASGRAYSRAVANTGGFGSSYATLAAEEAGRQVMEGLDDQQLALYQAAREEFDAERQSALDWYNATKQLYEDAYVLEQDAKAKAEEAAKEQAVADGALTETASAAAQELQNTWGTVFSEKTQREYLASRGYSEADINAALESQRKLASGTVTDYKAGTITEAITQAQSLDEAYRQGTLTVEEYDAAKAQNSKVIMDNVNKGMVRIDDVDHTALGFSDEEWGGMNDSDKKLAVIDRVGQMVKEGVVSKSAYFQMVEKEVSLDVQEIKDGGSRDENKELLSVAVVVQDLYDNGYITINAYNYMMFKDILPAVNIKELQDIYRNFDQKKMMTYGNDRNAAAEVLLRYYLDNTKEEEKTVPDSKKRKPMRWSM